jgi:hypothetical protein
MKLLVVPPHHDLTLEPVAPAGWDLLPLVPAFVRRVLSPDRLAAAADAQQAQEPPAGDRLTALLQLRVAQQGLATAPAASQSWLRAAGSALAGWTAPPCEVRLRLDDLELGPGRTTERLADVVQVARAALPWAPELEEAAAVLQRATRVRLWVDRDQQLPALLQIADRVPADVPLELAGPFARAHLSTLRQVPSLRRAEWTPEQVGFRIAGAAETDAVYRPLGAPIPSGPWMGYADFAELLRAEPGLERAAVVVVPLCTLSGDVSGFDGHRAPLPEVLQAVERRRAAGRGTHVEFLVGAPGHTPATLEATLRALRAGETFDWVTGVRAFHWPKERAPAPFAGASVELGEAAPDLDLARSRPLLHPAAEVPPGFIEQAARSLAAGRVAAALVHAPAPSPPGARVRRHPDCYVVRVGAASAPGRDRWYAVSLNSGALLAVNERLAQGLGALGEPTAADVALQFVPAPQREKIVKTLVDKGLLEVVR